MIYRGGQVCDSAGETFSAEASNSMARAHCAWSRCGWGLFGHFSLVHLFSFLSPSLGDSPI